MCSRVCDARHSPALFFARGPVFVNGSSGAPKSSPMVISFCESCFLPLANAKERIQPAPQYQYDLLSDPLFKLVTFLLCVLCGMLFA